MTYRPKPGPPRSVSDPSPSSLASEDVVTFNSMRFACPVCPERFGTFKAKKKHVRDAHPRKEA